MATFRRRRIGWWHLWLGVTLLVPLVWWVGTALVFALWPIEQVRGRTLSTVKQAPRVLLSEASLPSPDMVAGAQSVLLRSVEGHPIAIEHRDGKTTVWDLETRSSLGEVIPLPWARASAERDFAGEFVVQEVLLYDREGKGRRVEPGGGAPAEPPSEFPGPFPAYAFHLRSGPSMHLYVDALTGEVRARRTGIWRFYDACFRLHSLEFTPDGTKRLLILGVGGLWLGLGATGMVMATRTWKRGARKRTGHSRISL